MRWDDNSWFAVHVPWFHMLCFRLSRLARLPYQWKASMAEKHPFPISQINTSVFVSARLALTPGTSCSHVNVTVVGPSLQGVPHTHTLAQKGHFELGCGAYPTCNNNPVHLNRLDRVFNGSSIWMFDWSAQMSNEPKLPKINKEVRLQKLYRHGSHRKIQKSTCRF